MSQWSRSRACAMCGASLRGKRSDAQFCSKRCQNRLRTVSVALAVPPQAHKFCSRCEQWKPRAEFTPRPERGPGAVKPPCRVCKREAQTKHRHEHPDHYRAKGRERYRRNAAQIRAESGAWKRANREKARAHSAVEYALETGKLTRPAACEQCHRTGVVHGHHDDYTRKLDVRWLCPSCHARAHVVARAEAVAA